MATALGFAAVPVLNLIVCLVWQLLKWKNECRKLNCNEFFNLGFEEEVE